MDKILGLIGSILIIEIVTLIIVFIKTVICGAYEDYTLIKYLSFSVALTYLIGLALIQSTKK